DMSHEASILRWGACFNESEKWALYSTDTQKCMEQVVTAELLMETYRCARAENRLDHTLYTDVNHYLPGALLAKVDRMTMAHALEARSPFLDHKVMEVAARLPSEWKVKRTVTKRILRELFPDLLPRSIKKRGKAGFAIPLSMWFRGALYEKVKDFLLTPDTMLWHYMKQETVSRLLEEHRQGQADHGKRLWVLLCLETWLREYLPANQ
ncbi:MAG TPA: asparagine synthase C-terminal domain-containing protein, partial [Thermodesulfovibrionia bacterium]|nr:asparagine synthase C-terminal domain-containing protein [Thermodesulfovibrionia bacterium]